MSMISAASEVLDILESKGYLAYFVGGYIRDRLLGLQASDIDITSSATPEEISKIFKIIPVGILFGTVIVIYKNFHFEVTTFREDLEYYDNRHPMKVLYSRILENDLKRRDFTMNAIACDVRGVEVDLFGGNEDIKNHIIRAIGYPNERFKEDAIRILRAYVFVSKLGFTIEKKTAEAIVSSNEWLDNVSNERIYVEIKKIINGEWFLMALKYILALGTDKYLVGLEKGLKTLKNKVTEDVFFGYCFYLNEYIPQIWKFSRLKRAKYQKGIDFLKSNEKFSSYNIYKYGIDFCLFINDILVALNNPSQIEKIKLLDKNLPIHNIKDIDFNTEDLFIHIKNQKHFSKVINDIERKIIERKIINSKECIINYLKNGGYNGSIPR